MNDIFPKFYSCFCFQPKVSILLMAVFYVMGGSTLVLGVEYHYKGDFLVFKNFVLATSDHDWTVFFDYKKILPIVLIVVGVSYVLIGALTIFGQFFDQEVMVQLTIWATFFTLCLMLGLAILLGYCCAKVELPCVFEDLDYLTVTILVFCLFILYGMLVYFMMFINTQVEEL